ncbi:PorT family protein [Flavobacteriaceae bacterium]|nr:PorT family protein [Flavobacteriaceae bacterium]
MKKNILLKILLITGIGICNSQIKYGIKAGINYTNNVVVNIKSEDNKYLTSFNSGLFAKKTLNEFLGINTELLFSRKGYKIDSDENANPSSEGNLHLDYINLPLLLEYKPNEKFGIEVGTELGYLLSAKSKFESQTIDVSNFWDNKFDFGLAIGANYSLSEKFFLNFRYIHGLTSVIKDVQVQTDPFSEPVDSNIKFQNRTFQLSLGYFFE